MKRYFDEFSSLDDVRKSFEPSADDLFPTDEQVLFAAYGKVGYEGSAEVLFMVDGKLYEVSGGHCSCRGLEGQWEPQETDWGTVSVSDYWMSVEAKQAWDALLKSHGREGSS